jgi:hypothetical protein
MKAFTVIFVSKTAKAAKHPDQPARRIVSVHAKDEDEAVKLAKRSEMRYANRVLRDAHQQLTAHAVELGVDVMELSDPTSLDELKKHVKKTGSHDKSVLTNVEIMEQRADLDDWKFEGVFEGDSHLVSA